MQVSGVHFELAAELVTDWAKASPADCLALIAVALENSERVGRYKAVKEWAAIVSEESKNSSNAYKKRALLDLAERMNKQLKGL